MKTANDAAVAKPRVAVVTRFFDPSLGGAERYAVRLVEELAHQYAFHVFAQRIGHSHPLVQYTQLPWSPRMPRWINQLLYIRRVQALTQQGFDLIHSNENGWIGDVQVVHVRPMRYNLFHRPSFVRKLWNGFQVLTSPRLMASLAVESSRFTENLGARIITVSSLIEQETLAAYPHVNPRMTRLMPGVDLPSLKENASVGISDGTSDITSAEAEGSVLQRVALQERLGIDSDAQLGLFVASQFEKKGLDVLLQALSQGPASVHLLLVGGEDYESRYKQRIANSGLAGRVHYLGRLPDVSPIYRVADFLLHPTTQDSYAMVVVEAMAHGMPVVVTGMPWCGVSADLVHMQQAWLLPRPDDVEALSTALHRLVRDHALRSQLAKEGLVFAQRNSWPRRARELDALYQSLLTKSQADCYS